jgi:V/A-type H+-transporting ATPase subunit A
VGTESLDERDKLALETARMLKEGFLKQNAFDPIDAFTTPEKQIKLLQMFIDFYKRSLELVHHGITVARIREALGRLYVEMIKAKFDVPNEEVHRVEELRQRMLKTLDELEARSG